MLQRFACQLAVAVCIGAFALITHAAPAQIVIVRHGDKFDQPEPGVALSPKGLIRSVALALWYSKNFGEPDVIFASHAPKSHPDTSIRELETLGPLASLLSERHPAQGFVILHPYRKQDYAQLALTLLTDPAFQGKKVLVCWSHRYIPRLAASLGVQGPLIPWPSRDFDTVYVLNYDGQGQLASFEKRDNQYPVDFGGSFETLYRRMVTKA